MGGATDSRFHQQAAEMAERLDRAREMGEQLSFLATPDGGDLVPEEPRGPGRPKGSKNRVDTKLREMLAARGWKMPEDQLAAMAGLTDRTDPLLLAIERTEFLLSWAWDSKAGGPSASERLDTFHRVYTAMQRSTEAIAPYGLAKASPDVNVTQAVQINMPAPMPEATQTGHQPAQAVSDFAPPPMPHEMQQNQEVSKTTVDTVGREVSDGGAK